MAITRWAHRAVLTATALAFALPFTTGTAQADPIIEVLADNNVNLTIGASNNNVDSIPVSLNAGASLDTGSGITLDTNEGIQLAMDIGHAEISAGASVGVPLTNIGVEAAAAVDVAVAVAPPPAAEPEVAAPPAAAAAPEAAPVVEAAVTITDETITDDTAAVAEEPKGDVEEDDCPPEAAPSGCPNITALGILSVCLLPNLLQVHI